MKTRAFLIIAFALAFMLEAQFFNTSEAVPAFQAWLSSPRAGQVLQPGQVVQVEWKSRVPPIDPARCESEFALSLDGGATYPYLIGPWMDGNTRKFYWTVPDMPTNQAVLMLRYGCWLEFEEAYSPQVGNTFVIAKRAES